MVQSSVPIPLAERVYLKTKKMKTCVVLLLTSKPILFGFIWKKPVALGIHTSVFLTSVNLISRSEKNYTYKLNEAINTCRQIFCYINNISMYG